jgi:hypothetical protein
MATIAVVDDEPAVGGHPLIAPIASELVGQGSMKLEAPPCERVKRSASAPVKCQKASSLA